MLSKYFISFATRAVSVFLLVLWGYWLYWEFRASGAPSFPLETSFAEPRVVGYVAAPELQEISGLAASHQHPNYFWTHNDSGDGSYLYLIRQSGRLAAVYCLQGISAFDWEEIASAQLANQTMLFVADIGDNHAQRPEIAVHVLPEPATLPNRCIPHSEIITFRLRYPDGARDAEALLIDKASNELIIITKREVCSRIYTAPLLPLHNRQALLQLRGELPFNMVTAASLSFDEQEVVVKNYKQIFYWQRKNSEQPLTTLLLTPPRNIVYLPELQGEALAWTADGKGFLTVTERPVFMGSPVVFYGR